MFARKLAETGWKWVVQAWGIILNKFRAELLILGPILNIFDLGRNRCRRIPLFIQIHAFLYFPDYIILSVSDLLNKAKFKARRGLNELDKIFVPFVNKRFLSLSNAQVDQLFELFEIDDVSLADMIIYKKMDYPEILWFFIRIGISACLDLFIFDLNHSAGYRLVGLSLSITQRAVSRIVKSLKLEIRACQITNIMS